MLKQIEINDNELVILHRQSRLREFLIKLGKSVESGKPNSDKEALELGLEIALTIGGVFPIRWGMLKEHFTDIDTSEYRYFEVTGETTGERLTATGCLNKK